MKKTLACAIIMLFALLMVFSGCSSEETKDSGNAVQKAEDIKIETPYGALSFPYGFEEIVTWENETDEIADRFIFYAVLDSSKIKVYTISFSTETTTDEGDLLGEIQDSSGSSVYVYFLPENEIVNDEMSNDQKNTVYTAQETVNDVIASMSSIPGYTAK